MPSAALQSIPVPPRAQSNAELAIRLESVAQLLAAKGENPFKIRAYRRAAETIRGMGTGIDEMVRAGGDVTVFPGIGQGIASALREIVFSGKLGQLELLLASTPPEVAALREYPRLDPKRVVRIYKKLGISTVEELRARLASGEIGRTLGQRLEQHVRAGLREETEILLYDADPLADSIRRYLLENAGAERAEAAGEVRRRVEIVGELSFLVMTGDFPRLVEKMKRFAGGTELVTADARRAEFKLPAGPRLIVENATMEKWGLALLRATGADQHLEKLEKKLGSLAKLGRGRKAFANEPAVYSAGRLPWIPPELREGLDEVTRAAAGKLPKLVEVGDIRGELHAHTTSSDGRHTIAEMAEAAQAHGYEYLGITDHSQSLKIAGGLPEAALWKQIKLIDRLNSKLKGFRLLKSSEVDILADGTLDYSDELLRELDYTVCSIHSRFRLGKAEQTERILRAMDHPGFGILGHATGRLLLRRPGYEVDFERVARHAAARRCFFEINASPDRLDLSAAEARRVAAAGVRIAICTDAHSTRELDYLKCGIDVARRAGLEQKNVLNALSLKQLLPAFRKL